MKSDQLPRNLPRALAVIYFVVSLLGGTGLRAQTVTTPELAPVGADGTLPFYVTVLAPIFWTGREGRLLFSC